MIRKLFIFFAIAMLFAGLLTGKAGANQELITNGGFETGDFSGWTLSDPVDSFVSSGGHSGNFEAVLGTSGSPESISQTINTTAGQNYIASFWLASDDFLQTPTTQFQVLWNGNPLTTTPGLQNYTGAFDYTQFMFGAIATGPTSTIAFNFQNDNSVYHLDDVHASVPEPAILWLVFPPLAGLVWLRSRKTIQA